MTDLKVPLSIAIPTFNRKGPLGVLLNRLKEELELIPDWQKFLELIVINNGSTDGTKEYLDGVKDAFDLKVFHNETNLGMDGNFIKCFQVASGDWFWLCSDDDLPMVGSIGLILEAVKNNSSSMIYLPTLFMVGSLDGNKEKVANSVALKFESAHRFSSRVNGLFTFISCIICKRVLYFDTVKSSDYDSLKGTLFSFFEWEFEILKRDNVFGYFTEPMLIARAENSRGYNFAKVFTENFKFACDYKLKDRPDLNKVILDGMKYRHLPKLFYKTRIGENGDLDFEVKQTKLSYSKSYGTDFFYYFIMCPIFTFPLPLSKISLFIARIYGKFWSEHVKRS